MDSSFRKFIQEQIGANGIGNHVQGDNQVDMVFLSLFPVFLRSVHINYGSDSSLRQPLINIFAGIRTASKSSYHYFTRSIFFITNKNKWPSLIFYGLSIFRKFVQSFHYLTNRIKLPFLKDIGHKTPT